MRLLKVLLFFTLFLNSGLLWSQTNFIQGYYLTNSLDTIRGFIEYRSENRNFRICVFKDGFSGNILKLYPESIAGFSIDNKEFYERHFVENKRGEKFYGFFKVILKGKLSLLKYGSRYFVRDSKGEIFDVSKRSDVSQRKIKYDYVGLGLLKVLMDDCEGIAALLEEEYKSTPNFVRIFASYNQCMSSLIFESEKIELQPNVDLSIQFSPAISGLILNLPVGKQKFDGRLQFGIGCVASIFLPTFNENFRVMIEPNYSNVKFYEFSSFDNTNNDLFVHYSSLKVPVVFSRNFTNFFVDIGLQNQFIINQNLRWRVETIQQGNIYTTDQKIASINIWSGGYVFGFGIQRKIKELPVKSSIRFSQTISPKHPNRPNFQSIEFNFSIQLNK